MERATTTWSNRSMASDTMLASRRKAGAFSLLETLVVISIIAFLASLLLPGLSAAREQAGSIVCRSNLHQVVLANAFYAEDNGGVYCPGASDFLKNLQRWHGVRQNLQMPFDSSLGPLSQYLGKDGLIKQCPNFPAEEIALESSGFEIGNGGYGYNNAYVGVQLKTYRSGAKAVANDRAGAVATHVQRPAGTIMFADTAFSGKQLIEYSFVEPRFHPQYPGFRMDPSIQFRHRGSTNVGWCDGHVGPEKLTFTWSSGWYASDPSKLAIGWFGIADDNSLFDLQ